VEIPLITFFVAADRSCRPAPHPHEPKRWMDEPPNTSYHAVATRLFIPGLGVRSPLEE